MFAPLMSAAQQFSMVRHLTSKTFDLQGFECVVLIIGTLLLSTKRGVAHNLAKSKQKRRSPHSCKGQGLDYDNSTLMETKTLI